MNILIVDELSQNVCRQLLRDTIKLMPLDYMRILTEPKSAYSRKSKGPRDKYGRVK